MNDTTTTANIKKTDTIFLSFFFKKLMTIIQTI